MSKVYRIALPLLVALVAGIVLFFRHPPAWAITEFHWTGATRAGHVTISVIDSSGTPVPGASFELLNSKGAVIPGYFDNAPGLASVTGGTDGKIVLVRPHQQRYGGRGRSILGMRTTGVYSMEVFTCRLSAPGFKPEEFAYSVLFKSPHRSYEDMPKANYDYQAVTLELPAYEKVFSLSRKG